MLAVHHSIGTDTLFRLLHPIHILTSSNQPNCRDAHAGQVVVFYVFSARRCSLLPVKPLELPVCGMSSEWAAKQGIFGGR